MSCFGDLQSTLSKVGITGRLPCSASIYIGSGDLNSRPLVLVSFFREKWYSRFLLALRHLSLNVLFWNSICIHAFNQSRLFHKWDKKILLFHFVHPENLALDGTGVENEENRLRAAVCRLSRKIWQPHFKSFWLFPSMFLSPGRTTSAGSSILNGGCLDFYRSHVMPWRSWVKGLASTDRLLLQKLAQCRHSSCLLLFPRELQSNGAHLQSLHQKKQLFSHHQLVSWCFMHGM